MRVTALDFSASEEVVGTTTTGIEFGTSDGNCHGQLALNSGRVTEIVTKPRAEAIACSSCRRGEIGDAAVVRGIHQSQAGFGRLTYTGTLRRSLAQACLQIGLDLSALLSRSIGVVFDREVRCTGRTAAWLRVGCLGNGFFADFFAWPCRVVARNFSRIFSADFAADCQVRVVKVKK